MLQKKIEGKDYKKAKLSTRGGDLEKRWYVYFSLWSKTEQKFIRPAPEYISSRLFKTAEERKSEGKLLIDFFNKHLAAGNITLDEKTNKAINEEKQISKRIYTIIEAMEIALLTTKNDSDVGERTYYNYELTINSFIAFLKKRKYDQLSINELDKSICLEYMNSAYKNITGKTFNIYLGDVRAVTRRLVDLDIIDANPFSLVKNRKVIKKRKQIWADEHKDLYFKYVKENDLSMNLIGMLNFYACLRPVEITRLKKKYFILEKNLLIIPGDSSKNQEPDPVTLSTTLVDELKLYLEKLDPEEFLFSINLKPGKTLINRKVITDRFAVIRKKLGIPKEIKHYSLKHTFNSKMVQKKVDIYALSKHNRHHDIRQTMDYVTDLQTEADEFFIDPGF